MKKHNQLKEALDLAKALKLNDKQISRLATLEGIDEKALFDLVADAKIRIAFERGLGKVVEEGTEI